MREKRTNMKKIKTLFILTVAGLVLAGCQKKPDKPVNDNMDAFVNDVVGTSGDSSTDSKGSTSETSQESVEENVNGNAEYVRTINDDKLKVNVKVQAQVEIPDVDKLSVVRVSQKEMDNDFLNKFLSICEPDTVFTSETIYTKEHCQEELAKIESKLKEEQDEADKEESQKGEVSIETTEQIYLLNKDKEKWQRNYDMASDKITKEAVEKYAVTPQLFNVADELSKDPDSEFYQWERGLGTKEAFYGTNSGLGGRYVTVYMQNNDNYGSLFRYRVSRSWEIFVKAVVGDTGGIQRRKKADLKDYCSGAENYPALPNEADAAISADEAKTQAQNLMDKLELTDFECKSAELCYEIPDFRGYDKGDGYRMVYVMKYVRTFNGVSVDNEGGYMLLDDDRDKKIWDGEQINVYVNDDGIVGFDYLSPLELGETVTEASSLKSFDEIKTIFESGVTSFFNSGMENLETADGEAVDYSEYIDDEDATYTNITVNKVILRYTRLSEKSDFKNGLMVPVWDFIGDIEYGTITGQSGKDTNVVVFTINAVDGSIVDRASGY